jgi:DNA-binding response OmpR family regulator
MWPRVPPTVRLVASLAAMTEVLIATDDDAVFAEVEAALVDESTSIVRVRAGQAVGPAVGDSTPDLVVLDMQIGNMGGIAACLHLRHEAGAGRLPEVPVLMLLDRQADVFLARRSDADGWVVKPLESFSLRRAATAVIEGEGTAAVERALVGDVNPA